MAKMQKEVEMSKFVENQKVNLVLRGGGFATRETYIILEIIDGKVWLDNGFGNDPTGPFNLETGEYEESIVPGFFQRIEVI